MTHTHRHVDHGLLFTMRMEQGDHIARLEALCSVSYKLGCIAAALLAFAVTVEAGDWYVSPGGTPTNSGDRDSPWDIASALGDQQKVAPGDTVYLLSGTYRRRPQANFDVRLAGRSDQPIHVRPVPGGRATIDGGLAVHEPSAHVWIHELEIFVSENLSMSRELDEPGSHPTSYNRPWGGLNMFGGTDCRAIHLVIHDCAQGISSWSGAENAEIYGCLVYENGWNAPDRGHGHSIYTQNRRGTKVIRHCILSAKYPGSYTMHAYGSKRAYVDNYVVEENIAYGRGPFLIGGGRPSRNIRVQGNVLYSVSMRIGYDAPRNENCDVRENVIVRGTLDIVRYDKVAKKNNLVSPTGGPKPEGPVVRWFPSRYATDRAHLAICASTQQETLTIDARPFLSRGDRFRLMDPKDVFGPPLHKGVCEDSRITIPMGAEFRAFVVFRNR